MPKPTRGALIVVEGLDRAGKSSQCEVLRESLKKAGHDVKHIRFPGIILTCSFVWERAKVKS